MILTTTLLQSFALSRDAKFQCITFATELRTNSPFEFSGQELINHKSQFTIHKS